MSELDSQFVKKGLWVDLEKGPVMGQTITTDTQTGAFVIALLAILSGLGTAHLWHLVTFFLHQLRANGKPRDAFSRQQQAILRTLPTPGALIADSLKLFWHWKSKEGHWLALARISLLVLLAGIFVAMTWAASIFSSLVVDSSNLRVLVNSPYCGAVNITYDNFNDIGLSYLSEVLAVSEPFAEDCYLNTNVSLPAICNNLIRPKQLFTIKNVTCPWDPKICVGDDKPAINIDSGLIDLNEFGLNLRTQDRVQFRKSTTCAVLSLENRTTIINASDFPELNRDPLPQEELLLLYYGDTLHYDTFPNVTWTWSLAEANLSMQFGSRVSSAAGSPEWYEFGNQIALPEMQRNDTDLALRMIAQNFMMYAEPNDDLVFSAHKTYPIIFGGGAKSDLYYADFPVSVVGCAQQYQYCVAQTKGEPYCTELSALPAMPTKDNFPNANEVQLAALQVLVTSGAMFDQLSSKTFGLAEDIWEAEVMHVPNNQWQREVTRWEAIAWTGIHSLITDYAIGPKHRDPNADSYVKVPSTAGEKQLCQSQRMQKTGGFVNINLFGFVFITTFAFFVVTIDITLLKILVFLSEFRRLTGLSNRLSRWTQDGVLQLQRRAYEAHGRGSWIGLEEDVPLTSEKTMLEDLPIDSMPLTRIFIRSKHSKDSKHEGKEEDFSPRALRSTRTWATQDTAVSVGSSSLTKSKSKESNLRESEKE